MRSFYPYKCTHKPTKQSDFWEYDCSCPSCDSSEIRKNSLGHVKGDQICRYLCRSCGRRFSSVKQSPVIELKIKEDIVSQFVKELDAGSDLAQISVSHSDFVSEKTLNYSSFPLGENVGSHIDSREPTVEKGINAFASTAVMHAYAPQRAWRKT